MLITALNQYLSVFYYIKEGSKYYYRERPKKLKIVDFIVFALIFHLLSTGYTKLLYSTTGYTNINRVCIKSFKGPNGGLCKVIGGPSDYL